jgi:hypothetical protein
MSFWTQCYKTLISSDKLVCLSKKLFPHSILLESKARAPTLLHSGHPSLAHKQNIKMKVCSDLIHSSLLLKSRSNEKKF